MTRPKISFYKTTGGSMFPAILWDEHLVVKRVAAKTIRLGDLILFRGNNDQPICHRVKSIRRKNKLIWFQTKGDHNQFYDPMIDEKKVLGRVIGLKRKSRLFALSPQGFRYRWSCFTLFLIIMLKKILIKLLLLLQRFHWYPLIFSPILNRGIAYRWQQQQPKNYKFSAWQKGREVGWGFLSYSPKFAFPGWWIWSMETKILYRRIGIAQQLLQTMFVFARKKKISILYLNVCQMNRAALKLYQKLGFKIIPHSQRTEGQDNKVFVYMKKQLN